MTIDLSQLDHHELQNLRKELDGEFKKRQSTIIKDARREIRAIEQKYGATIEQILVGKKSEISTENKKTVEPKYRNPENSEQVWTGRGKKPTWYEQAIQTGKTEEE